MHFWDHRLQNIFLNKPTYCTDFSEVNKLNSTIQRKNKVVKKE